MGPRVPEAGTPVPVDADAVDDPQPSSVAGRRAAARESRAFLPEIQALRAVAVLFVVLFHLWPGRLTGGYVGVDVFFVISGFLITSHMLREVDRTGRLRLVSFYARRARRLLPAGLTVLAVAALGARLLLPPAWAAENSKEILASAFFVQNIYLALSSVTYAASDHVATTVEHYWSLSVEEQFYLLWPSLFLVSILVARRWVRRRTTTTIGATLLVVTVCSFAFSVAYTPANPSSAYFLTLTRAWEFGMGALLVLLLRKYAPPVTFSILLRWGGLLALAWSAWFYSQETSFPGYAAGLPVIGAVMIIFAGDTGSRDPTSRVASWAPVQWLGDVSYSVYLWHWPLIVLAPYVLGHRTTLVDKVGILLLTLLLAQLTRRYVEDLTRYWPRLASSPRLSLSAALACMLVLGAVLGSQLVVTHRQQQVLAQTVADGGADPCAGAAALPNQTSCASAITDATSPADAKWSSVWNSTVPGCEKTEKFRLADGEVVPGTLDVNRCFWGSGEPTRTVALVGDSHAQTWRAALFAIAKAQNWQVMEIYRAECPATYARSVSFSGKPRPPERCRTWTRTVTERLRTIEPDMVITTGYVSPHEFSPEGSGVTGFREVWADWTEFTTVYVVRDVPLTGKKHISECLSINRGDPLACSTPRERAVVNDEMVRAAKAEQKGANRKVTLLDFTDHFCDDSRCYAALGGVPVYYDRSHMTEQFSTSLAPFLATGLMIDG